MCWLQWREGPAGSFQFSNWSNIDISNTGLRTSVKSVDIVRKVNCELLCN